MIHDIWTSLKKKLGAKSYNVHLHATNIKIVVATYRKKSSQRYLTILMIFFLMLKTSTYRHIKGKISIVQVSSSYLKGNAPHHALIGQTLDTRALRSHAVITKLVKSYYINKKKTVMLKMYVIQFDFCIKDKHGHPWGWKKGQFFLGSIRVKENPSLHQVVAWTGCKIRGVAMQRPLA